MSEAYVAVGSNQNAPANIREALQHLRTRYGELRVSAAYESADTNGGAAPYVNLVVSFESILPAGQLLAELRDVERICGRDRSIQTASCPLDLDLLLVGNAVVEDGPLKLPHPELVRRPYMLRPLVDLAATMTHPSLGLTFEDLWDKLGGQHRSLHRFPYPLG
ncbi:MAG: 2-amino-4-hydroxy-6-hydroxymethyldihydropteridine diphosphokinase [Nevskiales bacterium]